MGNDLMKPRYEVIADYPDSEFDIGEVISLIKDTNVPSRTIFWLTTAKRSRGIAKSFFDKFPHLFRPLSWWEHREAHEMPAYVKDEIQVYKVKEWDGTGSPYVFIEDEIHTGFIKGCEYTPLYGAEPSTETEYNSYINKQQ